MDSQASFTESDLECMLFDGTAEAKPLPFSLLERITDGFSYKMEVGRGGFAVVYKAMLEKGVVAVKRLSNTYMYEKEFFGEVECLMKVKHKNIVRFLGYCVDTQGNMRMHEGKYVMVHIQQRLLCFEYLPNGGLNHYIKVPSCGLEWIDRYYIIKGICEGLHHLHQLDIVHLDLKPANILLDENMEPKITDFGISRSFEKDQTRVIATQARGTPGYMAPEFVSNLITKKYDLYGLGVIIMELVTGEKTCQGIEAVLKSWSDRFNMSGRTQEFKQIRVCVEIGIECTNLDPAKRPVDMEHIIERLPEAEWFEDLSPRIKVLDICITSSIRSLHSLDINSTNQWIITGEGKGHVRIWNYHTQKRVDSLKLPERSDVVCVKFITRKQWFAAASGCNIYVYNYETNMQMMTSINAGSSDKSLHALAVHPTKPYLLSSDYGNIKLWNWDKNWECTHIFVDNKSESRIYQIILSSKGIIAGASLDCTVKVCSLESPESSYSLSGHSSSVKCLDFFTWDDQEYLVTGSDDKTAKIWNMEQKICIYTLEACTYPVIFVMYQPELQILTIGSGDGSIYMWRITSCSRIRRRPPKLEHTIIIGHGDVLALACSMGRVVLAKKESTTIIDIDCANSREKSTDCSEPKLSTDIRQDRDKTSKVIAGMRKEQPILDVHPLEIRFSEPDEYLICSLHLTNKKDQHVAFRITEESLESMRCTSELPMYDIVSPGSTYTLVVTTGHQMKLEEEPYFNLVVQSSIAGERYIAPFISQSACDEFFEEAEDIGNSIHEVTLKAVYAPHRDVTSKYYNELHPLKHRFCPQLSESIPCSLHLTNTTDQQVTFRLVERSGDSLRKYAEDGLYGAVPPRSTCTLIMTAKEKALAEEMGTDLVLQSSISTDKYFTEYLCDKIFEEAKESGHVVYEVAVKAVHTLSPGETTSEVAVRPAIILKPDYAGYLGALDAHPTEPWIAICVFSGFMVWNYESKTTMSSVRVSEEMLRVSSIKFHAKRKWIVAMTERNVICVYDSACITEIQKIASFRDGNFETCKSLGVHPTKPYVVSASMAVWDGDKGWKCTHKFGHKSYMRLLAFNPEDPNSFVSVSNHYHVEVWRLDSTKPDYTMNGHSGRVNSLDFFKSCDRQYLITGSHDYTAKIWDLQEKTCIHTLTGFRSPVLYVVSIPGRPYLVTCSNNGKIHVWSSFDFRLKTTIDFEYEEEFQGLVCLMGSRRIAIGQKSTISIMDIDDDKEAAASEGNNQGSVCAAGQSSNP